MAPPSALTSMGSAATATKIIKESFEEWSGRAKDRTALIETFTAYADGNRAFGYNNNILLREYALTPILDAIKKSTEPNGTISVAYVPSGLGKTTAAMRALSKYSNKFCGIAICAGNVLDGEPYVNKVLELLRVGERNAPRGWMKCLFTGLKAASAKKDNRRRRLPLLILDEVRFSPSMEHPDSQFISAIKNNIRNTGIRVIVLTPDLSCANFLSAMNSLASILPMEYVYSSPQDFPDGNWLSMYFSIDSLKIACMNSPVLLNAVKSREDIGTRFDALVDTNATGYLNDKKPQFVIEALLAEHHEEEPNADPGMDESISTIPDTTLDDEERGCWASCQEHYPPCTLL